ncbi:phenylacetate--CoA ligase family protein [Aureitalea sp. L0-47]|uniref:phenylacetate--CoA ligase family protein n=1 Tax=Aureitalea sp. L0-47 TaxID=2816962 RepID=UPI00223904FC|nr:hypothetical protein [Aureitalea sp. L0-47]MCW5520392.1 phenylacetate--CoA ligase family protein [Aureitalea sp. L0-47]
MIKRIYKILPVWAQDLVISTYGYLIYRQRYGTVYRKKLEYFLNKDYTSIETERELQIEALRDFLDYAVTHSPFFGELYKDVDLSTINSISDLKKLPVIDKEMVRANLDKIYTIKEKDAVVSFTGGTTGKSLKVLFTKEDMQTRMAYLDAFKFRLGVNPFKSRKATFSGRSLIHGKKSGRYWRNNYSYRQRLYSTFHISQDTIPAYIKNLNEYKPDVINGFVSAIYELAEYIIRTGSTINFTPKAIFTTSESLTQHHRDTIEKAFSSPVYDQYASAEGAPFITECINGSLHCNLDTGVIERNEKGEMVVTSFFTRGTPLIRYNIGDIITFDSGSCSCGNSHPLVARIDGRKVDFLYNDSGFKVSLSHLADVIKGNPNSVIKMQFIQHDLMHIEVLLEVDSAIYTAADEEKIIKELRYRFGSAMKIEIKKVDTIPRESSGKFSLIKNYCRAKV